VRHVTLTRRHKIAPTGSLTLFERIVQQLLTGQIRFRVQLFRPQRRFGKVLLPVGIDANQNQIQSGALL
jgi:hypothetical protein